MFLEASQTLLLDPIDPNPDMPFDPYDYESDSDLENEEDEVCDVFHLKFHEFTADDLQSLKSPTIDPDICRFDHVHPPAHVQHPNSGKTGFIIHVPDIAYKTYV